MASAAAEQLTTLAFNTELGDRASAGDRAGGALAELAPSGIDRVLLHLRRLGVGRGGVEDRAQYFLAIGQPQRTKAIARDIAYHGVTLGALSFTGVERFKTPFGRPAIDVTHVSNTNRFRAFDGGDPEAFCARLLAEIEHAILAAGPEEVALIIAEPVQNAGGCLVAAARLLEGAAGARGQVRHIADGRRGDHRLRATGGVVRHRPRGRHARFDLDRQGPHLGLCPDGRRVVAERVVGALASRRRVFRHGITFGGHPVCAAVALKNIEIFERDGVLENVRALEPHLAERMETLRGCRSSATCAARLLLGHGAVKDGGNTRFDQDERERLLRGFMPGRLLEAGLIARADDRGDAVLQIAPPLISDRELLDEIVAGLGEVLADAGAHMGLDGA